MVVGQGGGGKDSSLLHLLCATTPITLSRVPPLTIATTAANSANSHQWGPNGSRPLMPGAEHRPRGRLPRHWHRLLDRREPRLVRPRPQGPVNELRPELC